MLSVGAAYEQVGQRRLDESDLARIYGTTFYQGFRSHCKSLAVSAEQLKELFGAYGYDPQRDDAAWETAAESKHFRDSKAGRGQQKP
jgi:hypothetical protein